MRINWQPNPLCTVIDLDPDDVERLRLKLAIEDLKERIYGAHFRLEAGEHFDEAIRELHIESLEDECFSKSIDTELVGYIDDLRGTHVGDCTCVPCSCRKCHAEHLLGIDTIEGLDKHSASYINSAFAEDRTLEQALEWLSAYRPERNGVWRNFPEVSFNFHVPRWVEEARLAAKWLECYRDKHFANGLPQLDTR